MHNLMVDEFHHRIRYSVIPKTTTTMSLKYDQSFILILALMLTSTCTQQKLGNWLIYSHTYIKNI